MPSNGWLEFVKEYRKKHPELSYKEVLREAGKVYNKQEGKSPAKKPAKKSKAVVFDEQYGEGIIADTGKKVIQKGIEGVAKLTGIDAKPISSMTDDERLFAEIANASYLEPNERPADIWGYSYIASLSDAKHATYAKGDVAKFSVRGTKVTDIEDLANDKVIAEGGDLTKSDRYKRANSLLKKVKDKYKKIWVTGHSLGGRLTQLLSKNNGNLKAYTFNAGSSPFQKDENLPGVTNLRIIGDPISTSPMGGKTKWFNDAGTLNKHSLDNFLIGKKRTREEQQELLDKLYNSMPFLSNLSGGCLVADCLEGAYIKEPECICPRCPTCGQRV